MARGPRRDGHRPRRARPAVRHRLGQAAVRAGMAAALLGSRGRAGRDHRVVPGAPRLVGLAEGDHRGGLRREGAMSMTGVTVATTPIPGLLMLRLDLRRDERGWFEEVW